MKKRTVLYNPVANKGRGLENAKQLEGKEPGDYRYEDITKIPDLARFMAEEEADREIIFTGGDGTLNYVVNDLYGRVPEKPLYYFPAGTGNDFINDLNKEKDCSPFPVNEYIHGLPTVVIGEERRRFINALGFGLDGYCCEESDRLQKLGKERAYTVIAALGILGKYDPIPAKVTVDGETREYKKVWMAPVMFGRFFGGGVMMGPSQDRKNAEHTVTSVVIHDISRIGAAMLFLQITAGKGERYPKYLDYRVGRHVTVEYARPTAAQIDGETRIAVKKAEVFAAED